jgi:tetratricopeptide (TPR) repeat protein
MLAYLGRKAEAMTYVERALAKTSSNPNDGTSSYSRHVVIRTYLALGEHEKALDLLERLLKTPYQISPGWLRLDPTFAPLRGNPRFEQLTATSS